MLARKRKTKDPCLTCGLNRALCICKFIPNLKLSTRLVLVVHAKELKRTTNSGRLAIHALSNSEMRVRGEDRVGMDLSDLLSSEYRPWLFYPGPDSIELTREMVEESEKPVMLIVPDGNWRQASKVGIRHKELANIPRVQLSAPNLGIRHLRAESRPEGMSTLEAIARAMRIIEGEKVFSELMSLYQLKLARTLEGRGVDAQPDLVAEQR